MHTSLLMSAFYVNFIASSLGSLAIGLVIGLLYVFIHVKAFPKDEASTSNGIISPKTYRKLLGFRLLLTTGCFMFVISVLQPNLPWLLSGFTAGITTYSLCLIRGISWI